MNTEGAHARIKYKKPPIVERVLTITGDLTPEVFYSKFEGWKEFVQPHLAHYDAIKDWKLNVQVKDGVPIFTEAQPEVQITHRFSRNNEAGKKLVSMRVLPNQLILDLHHDAGKPHYFEELFIETEKWIPQWILAFRD